MEATQKMIFILSDASEIDIFTIVNFDCFVETG